MFLFYLVSNFVVLCQQTCRCLKSSTRTSWLTSRHYSRAIWTSFYQFWVHVFWALELKIVDICMKEKFKFFVNYNKWLQRSRNFHYEALETLKMLWLFSSVIMQNCEWQDGCFKETKHAKFSEKRTFLIPWFAHISGTCYVIRTSIT